MWSCRGLGMCGEAKERNVSHFHGILQLLLPTWLHLMFTETAEGDKNYYVHFTDGNFPGGSDGKASAYNAEDLGSIPGLGRSSGEGNSTHSSTLAWKIPWMEECGRLQSMGSQRVRHN